MNRTHPEGLPFEPEGPGFTERDNVTNVYHRLSLLTEHNIEAVRKNHPAEWSQAFFALPAKARDKFGRPTGLTDDERRRLATLSTLVEQRMFEEDRMVVIGQRQGGDEAADIPHQEHDLGGSHDDQD